MTQGVVLTAPPKNTVWKPVARLKMSRVNKQYTAAVRRCAVTLVGRCYMERSSSDARVVLAAWSVHRQVYIVQAHSGWHAMRLHTVQKSKIEQLSAIERSPVRRLLGDYDHVAIWIQSIGQVLLQVAQMLVAVKLHLVAKRNHDESGDCHTACRSATTGVRSNATGGHK